MRFSLAGIHLTDWPAGAVAAGMTRSRRWGKLMVAADEKLMRGRKRAINRAFTAQRFSTDPQSGTGSAGALFTATANADGSLNVTPASGTNSSLAARIYYSGSYFDNADRLIASVNAGTNPTGTGGTATPWTRPGTAPVSYNDPNFTGDLVTLNFYNPAGWQSVSIDARGTESLNLYNNLGETTQTVAAYDTSVNSGNPTSSQNQTTDYTFDGIGDQTSMTAVNVDANTGALTDQTTQYLYGVSTATGSTITSNDLLYQTVYPSVGDACTGHGDWPGGGCGAIAAGINSFRYAGEGEDGMIHIIVDDEVDVTIGAGNFRWSAKIIDLIAGDQI